MGKTGALARGSAGPDWSEWRLVDGFPATTRDVLAEIVDGGQAFRWYRCEPECWLGAWAGNVARLRVNEHGLVEWSAPTSLANRVGPAVRTYLGADTDFTRLTHELPWRSDPHLATCLAAFPGLRLLRQPFGETLLGFLCSATKQIVQIKQMVALLAERHGEVICRLADDRPEVAGVAASARPATSDRGAIHALPTWEKLATIPEAELRMCLLGFRAKYIAQTARFLAAHPGWLEETETLPYADAKERLCTLPGVGEKVADCVLLFGAGRLEAFPVDVWILKTMAKRYGLDGWKPAQLTQFGRVHFGSCAGLAQQFLFAWERRHGGAATSTPTLSA